MSRLWLYLGIVLTCSGVGTTFGTVLLMMYFWDDIKNVLKGQQALTSQNGFGIDSMSDNLREELR